MGGSYKWPSVHSVANYRQQVQKIILDVIESATFDSTMKIDTPLVNSIVVY